MLCLFWRRVPAKVRAEGGGRDGNGSATHVLPCALAHGALCSRSFKRPESLTPAIGSCLTRRQQAEGVPVARQGMRARLSLPDETIGEERLGPRPTTAAQRADGHRSCRPRHRFPRRFPRPSRTRSRQQCPQPECSSCRDPLLLPLCGVAFAGAQRTGAAGARHAEQTICSSARRLPQRHRSGCLARGSRPQQMERAPPRRAGNARVALVGGCPAGIVPPAEALVAATPVLASDTSTYR
jgi:hypothetical protein